MVITLSVVTPSFSIVVSEVCGLDLSITVCVVLKGTVVITGVVITIVGHEVGLHI